MWGVIFDMVMRFNNNRPLTDEEVKDFYLRAVDFVLKHNMTLGNIAARFLMRGDKFAEVRKRGEALTGVKWPEAPLREGKCCPPVPGGRIWAPKRCGDFRH